MNLKRVSAKYGPFYLDFHMLNQMKTLTDADFVAVLHVSIATYVAVHRDLVVPYITQYRRRSVDNNTI